MKTKAKTAPRISPDSSASEDEKDMRLRHKLQQKIMLPESLVPEFQARIKSGELGRTIDIAAKKLQEFKESERERKRDLKALNQHVSSSSNSDFDSESLDSSDREPKPETE